MAAAPSIAQDATAPQDTTGTAVPDASTTAAPAPAPAYDSAPPQASVSPPTADGIDPTFTGPRVEGFGGVDIQKYSFRPLPAGADDDHTGGVAGALVGYDIGFRNLVVGGFGTFALPTSNFCAQRPALQPGRCVRPDREIEGGVRLGFKAGDSFLGAGNRILVYAKGSYVNTLVKVQSTFTGGGTFNTHRNRDGWRVGGGAEYALNEHAYVKAEYNYTRTDRLNLQPYGFANTDFRQSKHQILGGFGIRF